MLKKEKENHQYKWFKRCNICFFDVIATILNFQYVNMFYRPSLELQQHFHVPHLSKI